MARFTFPLAALLRYRRHRRDLCRSMLAQVLAGERRLAVRQGELERERGSLLGELRALGAGGGVDVDRTASRRYYAGRLSAELLLTERRRDLAARQVELCRQALLHADRDVKVLEKLEAQRRSAFLRLEQRREDRERDEAWLGAHAGEFTG